jgi:GNAT superfamily N-acetyltransferase
VTGTRIDRRQDPEAVDRILRSLPAWFGIEEAIQTYVHRAARLPSYLATIGEEVVGVALVERHFPESAEIHLIAVDPLHHGSGVGSAPVRYIEDDLRADGARVLQVHTVGPSFDNEEYAKTRQFYGAAGFIPLREVDGLDWDGPTLILVKSLRRAGPFNPHETRPSTARSLGRRQERTSRGLTYVPRYRTGSGSSARQANLRCAGGAEHCLNGASSVPHIVWSLPFVGFNDFAEDVRVLM